MMRQNARTVDLPRDDRHIVCRTSAVSLSDFTGARREATRPLQFRGESFERDFDSTTLFYDAARVGDSGVALFAPPFLNLSSAVAATSFSCAGRRYAARARRLDRHAQLWLDIPANSGPIRAEGPLGRFEFLPSPSQSWLFRDCRVIFTMSKNNPIEWIVDWVKFNRDVHGADAVLIYDNGSSAYDSTALSAALRSIPGLQRSVVVVWPFKYGPQGTNIFDNWDSDFCQLGAWEHARWRFLQEARSAMNSDIDELVLSQSGRSVFDAAERSRSGLVRYGGRWIIGIEDGAGGDASATPRHTDFSVFMPPDYRFSRSLLRRDMNECPAKWTIVPRRCPPHAQWHVHRILGWWANYLRSREFSFRHFREIGSNWKYQRTSRVPFDPLVHKTDELLRRTFRRVDWTR
jgi:hypothetical protein